MVGRLLNFNRPGFFVFFFLEIGCEEKVKEDEDEDEHIMASSLAQKQRACCIEPDEKT